MCVCVCVCVCVCICIIQTYSMYLCGVSMTARMPPLIISSGGLGVLQTLRFQS